MKFIKNTYQKKLKFFLTSLIFLIFAVILVVFLQYRHFLEKNDTSVSISESKANISIDRLIETL